MLTTLTTRPRTISRATIGTPRGDIAALEARPPDGAEVLGTVVLVSPYLGAKELYAFAMTAWARSGYRVLSYDHLGQGESHGPDDPAAYAVELLAADLISVLVQADDGKPVHVLGHSAGGFIARSAALQPGALCRSLCLLGSGPTIASSRKSNDVRLVAAMLRDGQTEELWASVVRDARTAGLSPAALARLRNLIDNTSTAYLSGLAQSLIAEPFPAERLRALAIPKLAIFGSCDHAWPIAAYTAMATQIGAQTAQIDGGDHNPLVTHPKLLVNLMMSFWHRASVDSLP